MKKFGLIGHPIAHSLSPALFKAAFGGRYTYDLIEEDDFGKAFERFIDEYDAINVTAPFKELAFRKANAYGEECMAIGAANILKKHEDSPTICAHNSDIAGVTGSLESAGMTYGNSRKALIVGCGGAAMAATYAVWNELGYDTVVINRNLEKAQSFVERLKNTQNRDSGLSVAGLDRFEEIFRDADVIVYTLPVAIPALLNLNRSAIRGGSFWERRKNKVILEANYKDPALTPDVMERMHGINPGITFVSGKEWLLYQAVEAYRHFVPDTPDIDAMRAVIR